jgi:hypothetical protein
MQNHLTEMLALVAMDLLPPAERTNDAFIAAKSDLLSQVSFAPLHCIILVNSFFIFSGHSRDRRAHPLGAVCQLREPRPG